MQYETTKLSYFSNTKYKISLLRKLSVVYKLVCPGCSLEKQSALWESTEEHACKNNKKKEQSTIYEHLLIREHYNHIVDLFNLNNSLTWSQV